MKFKRQQTTLELSKMLPKVDTTADFAPQPPQEIHLIITVGATRKYSNPIKSNQVKKKKTTAGSYLRAIYVSSHSEIYQFFNSILRCSYEMKFVKSQHVYQHIP